MSNSQEQKLVMIYKRMSSAEIRERVASGELIPLAMGVAENELQQRLARGDSEGTSPLTLREKIATRGQLPGNEVSWTFYVVIAIAIALTVASAIAFPGMSFFILIGAGGLIATLVGNAFPRFGKVFGRLLQWSPLVFFAILIYWHRANKWDLIELMVYCALTIFYSIVTMAIGSFMLKAAMQQKRQDG